MPFIRYSRDKRGYETTVVLHAYRSGPTPQRNRVLYLFRTPSNVRVGRRALDEEVIEALEHTHPDLSFDWSGLQRDVAGERADLRERGRAFQRRPPRPGRPPAQESTPPVIEDQTPLGRVAGAREAARLRAKHADLLQRIARRARTPEERDRLTERLQRLNPDEPGDEVALRERLSALEPEWDALAAELPQRRRGRRGGRGRHATGPGAPVTPGPGLPEAEAGGGEPSVIMAEQGEEDEDGSVETRGRHAADRGHDGTGHGGGDGAGDATPATAADTDPAGPAAGFHEDR